MNSSVRLRTFCDKAPSIIKSKIVRAYPLRLEPDARCERERARPIGALVFGFSPASFPSRARPNLSLALGRNCVHTFARLKFPLSRIHGDVPVPG
jgi:hypothetical protein